MDDGIRAISKGKRKQYIDAAVRQWAYEGLQMHWRGESIADPQANATGQLMSKQPGTRKFRSAQEEAGVVKQQLNRAFQLSPPKQVLAT